VASANVEVYDTSTHDPVQLPIVWVTGFGSSPVQIQLTAAALQDSIWFVTTTAKVLNVEGHAVVNAKLAAYELDSNTSH
jgi:hypothetical protein